VPSFRFLLAAPRQGRHGLHECSPTTNLALFSFLIVVPFWLWASFGGPAVVYGQSPHLRLAQHILSFMVSNAVNLKFSLRFARRSVSCSFPIPRTLVKPGDSSPPSSTFLPVILRKTIPFDTCIQSCVVFPPRLCEPRGLLTDGHSWGSPTQSLGVCGPRPVFWADPPLLVVMGRLDCLQCVLTSFFSPIMFRGPGVEPRASKPP